jgi:hypothetical protein
MVAKNQFYDQLLMLYRAGEVSQLMELAIAVDAQEWTSLLVTHAKLQRAIMDRYTYIEAASGFDFPYAMTVNEHMLKFLLSERLRKLNLGRMYTNQAAASQHDFWIKSLEAAEYDRLIQIVGI